MRAGIVLALLLAALPALAQGRAGRCEGEAWEDRLLRVTPLGDLATASGSLLRLADLRLGEDAAAILAAFEGEAIAVGAAGAPDRWGRRAARVLLAQDGTDLAILLLREGLALVDTGEAPSLCRPALLAEEVQARGKREGVWAGILLPAGDAAAIADRAGSFAVVEGVVSSVGERARRTYLNFGPDFRRDFAVSIPRRNWEEMKRAGLSADLKGRRIRVRGLVEMRRAPAMEITSADMIERLGMGDPRPSEKDGEPQGEAGP
ncbi:DNA-binding protein [Enterovirga sp.]|uniref:thermonuclease family protein n=1 Tax=Enterovirga sp. TaxID=2026350 RepID=UPI002D05C7EC|nr:DNA-binding protein [Enterovirga sp.]HMO29921.1 DNA-binding protein [Enterovirga sp.]